MTDCLNCKYEYRQNAYDVRFQNSSIFVRDQSAIVKLATRYHGISDDSNQLILALLLVLSKIYFISCVFGAKEVTLMNTDKMMTSSNENIFRVTGHLCGEFTGHRWTPRTKASDAELDFFLDLVNNRETGDLRRFRAHYDVTVVKKIALNPNLATNGPLPFDYMVPANMIVWAHIVTINFTLTFLVALYSFAIADWFCGNVYTKAETAT